MKKHVFGLMAVAVLVLGCHKQSGNEYLGKWQNVKNPKDNIEVVQNGDNFLVKASRRNFVTGETDMQSIPATLKDGTLQAQGGMGAVALAIDHSNGHLVTGTLEYKHPN